MFECLKEKVADARGVRGLAILSVPYSGTQARVLLSSKRKEVPVATCGD